MVELSGKDDPFQHGFPNVVFILPAIVVAGLAGKLLNEEKNHFELNHMHKNTQTLDLTNIIWILGK